jgi:hypothetical protein
MNLVARRRHKIKQAVNIMMTVENGPQEHLLPIAQLPPHPPLPKTTMMTNRSGSHSNSPMPSMSWWIMICASLYVMSGVTQVGYVIQCVKIQHALSCNCNILWAQTDQI